MIVIPAWLIWVVGSLPIFAIFVKLVRKRRRIARKKQYKEREQKIIYQEQEDQRIKDLMTGHWSDLYKILKETGTTTLKLEIITNFPKLYYKTLGPLHPHAANWITSQFSSGTNAKIKVCEAIAFYVALYKGD